MNLVRIGGLLSLFCMMTQAAETSFPIFFPDSKLIVKADVLSGSVFLPIDELVTHLGLAYTDSVSVETGT